MPLSKLTVATLADRGYVVNMAMVSFLQDKNRLLLWDPKHVA